MIRRSRLPSCLSVKFPLLAISDGSWGEAERRNRIERRTILRRAAAHHDRVLGSVSFAVSEWNWLAGSDFDAL